MTHTRCFILTLCLLASPMSVAYAQTEPANWKSIEDVFGRKGMMKDGYFKVTFPRSDLHVTVGDVAISPGLALTGWFGFEPHGSQVMVMGDLALTDAEVPAVESKLVQEGFEITALHNHLIGETPTVKFMHIEGSGEARALAEKLRAVLEVTATPMTAPPPPKPSTINWSTIQSIMGSKGSVNGAMLQYGLPRAEKIMENGMEVPPFLGMANSINFQMSGDKVAATGDFVLIASEVNPVIAVLREHGIVVTAVHNHMLMETPRMFMLHFWANDTPENVARGLRAALNKVSLKK